jgi:NADH-quinone oxidoreductase subunit N
MTASDLLAILPLVILAATSVLLLLLIAFFRHHWLAAGMALLGLAAAFVALVALPPGSPRAVTPLLVWDSYAAFFTGLIVAAAFVVTVLSIGYLRHQPGDCEEYYLLLVLATLGAAVLAASSHLASFFLGLEVLSISLYTLLAYLRHREVSIEAGVKYLILAGVSSAFLLFGMALIYAALGTMALADLPAAAAQAADSPLLLAGMALLLVGVGFKLAIVPFHMWTADVYQGAPAPVTAFVATVSKGAVLALLLRFLAEMGVLDVWSLFIGLALIAVASILVGNLLALRQTNVKRLLAYSSIAHLGYMLIAVLAGGQDGASAVALYLVAYTVTTLLAFGILAVLSGPEHDAEEMDDLHGLFWRRPWLAALMTAAMLSLAGIPLTAGFVGKFVVVAAGASAALWVLLGVLVVGSALGVYYYLRVVLAMLSERPAGEPAAAAVPSLTMAGALTLAILGLLLLGLGVYPTPLIDLIERTVAAVL